MTFVKSFLKLRLYDLCELIEKNEWVLQKISKMAISQSCYFKIFAFQIKNHMHYVPDL